MNQIIRLDSLVLFILYFMLMGSVLAEGIEEEAPKEEQINAVTYYVSNLGSDNNNGLSPNSAWKTLAKVNASMGQFQPGDKIYFEKGDVFKGSLNINRSGADGNPITFGAYGSGANPIIESSVSLTNWENQGGNVWKTTCSNCPGRINNLYINNRPQQIGRYPNFGDPNDGYLNIDGGGGNTQLTDNELPASPNWTGGDAVIRSTRWTTDRVRISNHSGTSLQFSEATSYNIGVNFGYFIQNHPQTLDRNGEWCFINNEVLLYLDNKNPNTLNVQVSKEYSSLTLNHANHIRIENMVFQNSNEEAVKATNSSSVEFVQNKILGSGKDGGVFSGCHNLVFQHNHIRNTNNNALSFLFGNNTSVRHNNIENTGLKPGMGKNGDLQYKAVMLVGEGSVFANNSIDSSGYIGVRFEGNNVSIENNFVSNFCLTMDDGSGIYTWSSGAVNYGRRIVGNVVVHGIGASLGTSYPNFKAAEGIYVDDRSANVEIRNNTVAFCSGAGIYIHNSSKIDIQHNLLFSNELALRMIHDHIASNYPIYDCNVQNNVFFAAEENQHILELRSYRNDMLNFGTFDNNRYCSPFNLNDIIAIDNGSYQWQRFSLDSWKAYSNLDANTQGSPVQYASRYRTSSTSGGTTGPNMIENPTFDQGITPWLCWSNTTTHKDSWEAQSSLDGGAIKLDFATRVDGSFLWSNVPIGAIEQGKTYQLSFDVKGSTNGGVIGARLRQHRDPYHGLSDLVSFPLSTSRQHFEAVLSPTADFSAARLEFELHLGEAPVWLDNVSLKEVESLLIPEDEFFQFEYNLSENTESIIVDRSSVDAFGQAHCKDEVLQLNSFGSFLAMRIEEQASKPVFDLATAVEVSKGNISACSWEHFFSSDKSVASLNPDKQTLAAPVVKTFSHPGTQSTFDEQPALGRNWVVQFAQAPQKTYSARLYFSNNEWEELKNRSSGISSFQDLSLWVYQDADDSRENGSSTDNQNGSRYEYNSSQLSFEPHPGGFYVEFTLPQSGEIWLVQKAGTNLPVVLSSFDLTPTPVTINLSWTSTSEINSSHYEIQRSVDGQLFQNLGRVESQGTSAGSLDYTYEDAELIRNQTYYYRLKMVDKDGSFEYSRVLEGRLENSSGFNIKLYPNPVEHELNLDIRFLEQMNYRVIIYNTTGNQMFKTDSEEETERIQYKLDVSAWPAGIYYISVEGIYERSSLSFIKP